jgi:enoyl-CoA hydratase
MATTVTKDGDVALVRLDEGRGNSLSYSTIAALTRALDDAAGAAAVVLTGAGKVFSAGLDLRACAVYDRAEMRRYVDAFESLFERVFTHDAPIVAALNGHAIAGGAVIALACDVRVMSSSATLALNEVELGLPFPSMAFEIGRFGFPVSAHVDGIMLGKTFSAADALERGVVHAVVDGAHVEATATARARDFAARGREAVSVVKRMLRAEAVARANANAKSSRAAFIDAFFGADAQKRIGDVVARLVKR